MNSYADKIRKSWLISLWVISIWTLVLVIFGVLEIEAPDVQKIVGVAIFSLIIFALAYATYHVAYKRAGTKWLTFLAVFIPLRIVIDLAQIGWSSEIGVVFIYLILAIPEIYFWINCLYLRGLNTKLQSDSQNTDDKTKK